MTDEITQIVHTIEIESGFFGFIRTVRNWLFELFIAVLTRALLLIVWITICTIAGISLLLYMGNKIAPNDYDAPAAHRVDPGNQGNNYIH